MIEKHTPPILAVCPFRHNVHSTTSIQKQLDHCWQVSNWVENITVQPISGLYALPKEIQSVLSVFLQFSSINPDLNTKVKPIEAVKLKSLVCRQRMWEMMGLVLWLPSPGFCGTSTPGFCGPKPHLYLHHSFYCYRFVASYHSQDMRRFCVLRSLIHTWDQNITVSFFLDILG